ncbi:hypothetical protein DL769_009426 [Monosporascus sp. CRB-8-3]|nr:hypothetical protein DL769_009426 [Monosporascus sp. CRB-8-3]
MAKNDNVWVAPLGLLGWFNENIAGDCKLLVLQAVLQKLDDETGQDFALLIANALEQIARRRSTGIPVDPGHKYSGEGTALIGALPELRYSLDEMDGEVLIAARAQELFSAGYNGEIFRYLAEGKPLSRKNLKC